MKPMIRALEAIGKGDADKAVGKDAGETEGADPGGDEGEPVPERFRPLGEYDWPSTPVDRGLKRLVGTLQKRFLSKDDGDGVDLSRLAATERSVLDRIVAPPANEPLAEELKATLADWLAGDEEALAGDADTLAGVRVVVLPPCDEEDFIRGWAERCGLSVLEPPDRADFACPADFPGEAPAIVVVPRLEEWFLRHDTRLGGVRELIRRIDRSERRVLIGCNSWAWQFLVKSCAVDAVLPEPLTFTAFDAERLRHWLKRLAEGQEGGALRFRAARSGRDAFAEDAERGGEEANTMSELAERSLGIPWVAWNMWRASLRTSDAAEESTDIEFDGDDAQTLWVTELRNFALPDHKNQEALLVLHTLLVHGRLTEEEIHLTVPIARYTNAISALKKSGMVQRVDGVHSCVPAAYPAIRDGLRVAGYPMDVL